MLRGGYLLVFLMLSDYIRIPQERIGVLIGVKGTDKRKIEKKSKTKINIDSDSGEVYVEGEPLDVHKALQVIQAVGRGFNPEKALKLLEDKYYLRILKLKEMFGKKEKKVQHKKGRVIGRKGLIRNKIEQDTKCFISIYGNTIAIIGEEENIEAGEQAVRMLLGGMEIDAVENVLHEKELNEKKFEL